MNNKMKIMLDVDLEVELDCLVLLDLALKHFLVNPNSPHNEKYYDYTKKLHMKKRHSKYSDNYYITER